jgi:hypothetical protein
MSACTLARWLLLLDLALLLLVPFAAALPDEWLRKRLGHHCALLGKLRLVVAIALGIALAAWLACDADRLGAALGAPCRAALALGLVALTVGLVLLVRMIARCAPGSLPGAARLLGASQRLVTPVWTALLTGTVVLFVLVWRCCRGALAAEPGFSCGVVFFVAWALVLLLAFSWLLGAKACPEKPRPQCPALLTWLARAVALLLVALIVLVAWCCGRLAEGSERELAMVGIWWEGAHDGEAGAHLRWSFAEHLTFPEDGFDLWRRRSNSGEPWARLNDGRIHPVTGWDDDGAGPTGRMWRAQAVERLHSAVWSRYREPLDELLEVLSLPPFATLYYVETPPEGVFDRPENPYLTEQAVQVYLDAYDASASGPPLLTWELRPMETLRLASVYADIARLLGLYYLDSEADPATAYDYRVIGYWRDRPREYTVERLSRATTAPLEAPILEPPTSPVPFASSRGEPLLDERAVGLRWRPPVAIELMGDPVSDTLAPLLYSPERARLETLNGPPGACGPELAGETFAGLSRPDDSGAGQSPVPPVLLAPLEDEATGALRWPAFFAYDREVPPGVYAYRVIGQDLFGRASPPSLPCSVRVEDRTGPPPPVLVTATLHQCADPERAAVSDVWCGPAREGAGPDDFALVVEWLWPHELRDSVDDLDSFRVYLRHRDHQRLLEEDWRAPDRWDEPRPLARRGAGEGREAGPPRAGARYQVVLTRVEHSLAELGLAANDEAPVRFAYVGVGSVDERDNHGPISTPVLVVARDLEPPCPPPAPVLTHPVTEADRDGNSQLRLSWPAEEAYRYDLFRLAVDELAPPVTPEGLACTECGPASCEPPCLAALSELYRGLEERGARWRQVSTHPLSPVEDRLEAADRVDATESGRYLYAGRARDPAGNTSPLSCPAWVDVPDRVAPRPPVLESVIGGESGVTVTWTANPERDLWSYTLYRAAVAEHTLSRRRMRVVAQVDPEGRSLDPDTADAVLWDEGATGRLSFVDDRARAGETYHYRLDAVDRSGNRSPLSATMAASAIDVTPPAAPVFAEPALELGGAETGRPWVRVRWLLPDDDPDLRVLVQRRDEGRPVWQGVGGWLEAGSSRVDDHGVRPGASFTYRLRAMDPMGNRSEVSDERTIAIPDAE